MIQNANELVTALVTAFVMHCDEQSMSQADGEKLAEQIADDMMFAAVDRRDYLPEHLKTPEEKL